MNPIDDFLLLNLIAKFQRFLEHYESLIGQVSEQVTHSRLRRQFNGMHWNLQALLKMTKTSIRMTKAFMNTEKHLLMVSCDMWENEVPTAEDCKHVAALHRNISITQNFDLWHQMSRRSVIIRDLMLAGV